MSRLTVLRAGLVLLAVMPAGGVRSDGPRGPIRVSDEYLLAQPRLTLPAVSPDPLERGETRLRFYVNRGNDFTWSQTRAGEDPGDRRYIVDGEHNSIELGVRHALSPRLDLGLRVPLRWRGGGFMDEVIDSFHGIGGLDPGDRSRFLLDRFRIEGRDDAFRLISWTDERGTGLGNIELEAHWSLTSDPSDWRAALVGRLTLPTGTGPYDTDGVDVGLQLGLARQLHRRWHLYAGAGSTYFSEDVIDGIEYEHWRAHGFLALEWLFASRWSLLVQTDVSSRLVKNLADFPGVHWYYSVGAKLDLSRRLRLEMGFTENITHQRATTDIGVFAGLVLRIGEAAALASEP